MSVRSGAVVWTEQTDRTETLPLDVVVAQLLSRLPDEYRRRHLHLRVALGGFGAQPKHVTGIPPTSAKRLRSVLQAGADRYFTATSAGTLIGEPRPDARGVWATAYDAGVVSALRQAAAKAGMRTLTLLPIPAVLVRVRGSDAVEYRDGPALVHCTHDADGRLGRVRRTVIVPEADAPTPVRHHMDSALYAQQSEDEETLGRDAALGAVLADAASATPLRVRLREPAHSTNARLATAGAVAGLALVAALLAPAAAALRTRNEFVRDLRAVAPQRTAAVQEQRALALATQAITELAAFDRSRRPVLPLLTRIARAMPPGSAIIEFHLDTAAGTIVAVTPRAADLVDAVSRLPGLTAPTIVGPVTPEQLPVLSGQSGATTSSAERVTIRFQPTRTRP